MTQTLSEARIYLDWAATTPLCDEAYQAMEPFLAPGLANTALGMNANSLHSEGRAAFSAMEQARSDIASCIGARSDEIYFTSGATESDNWALLGLVNAALHDAQAAGRAIEHPRIIISSIEHEAIEQAAKVLQAQGVAIDYAKPNAAGFITPQAVADLLSPDTVLVSVMTANNEIGAIQPIAAIAQLAHEAGCLMHTDAAQALCKTPFNVDDLGIDAASFSAHKICGPKGMGALYLRRGTSIRPFMVGGGQEHGLRSGTQNVVGMVGMAAAVKALCGQPEAFEHELARQRSLRDRLYAGLSAYEQVTPNVQCEPGATDYLPNIVSVCVDDLESESLILRFDMLGFAISGGSACSSGSLEPSHVLVQLGVPRDRALGVLRVSLGRYTQESDIEAFLEAFNQVINWQGE